ncbi:CPXCG motif-containing cysteine-rich protein [candidate division GN15 bacterium]|nr:CPXCG motif-containing cysteine-rich protein [candidate division GN15 bacterium]
MEQTWQCACCGEENETFIDPQGGDNQEFVEDCPVCCRPNVITARYNPHAQRYDLSTYQEDVG